MDFGQALAVLRTGGIVSRDGWNGKGMSLELQRPDAHSKMTHPYIFIRTADGQLVPWGASQTDLLADDWQAIRGRGGSDSAVCDPATERMRRETGHDCITCPGDVRNLMATAHNLLGRLDAADWSGVARKKESMREALAALEPISASHFAALDDWRRP